MEKEFELKAFAPVTKQEMTEVNGGGIGWFAVVFTVALVCGFLGGIADGYNKA